MTLQQLMETRKPKVKVTKVRTTKELMEELNIKNNDFLANRLVDSIQSNIPQTTKYRRHAAVVDFEDLKLTNTLTVRVPLDSAMEGAVNVGSSKYQFEVKDKFTHYGTVSVYTSNYVAAIKVIEKYLTVAYEKIGKVMYYSEKGKNIWREGNTYEQTV